MVTKTNDPLHANQIILDVTDQIYFKRIQQQLDGEKFLTYLPLSMLKYLEHLGLYKPRTIIFGEFI